MVKTDTLILFRSKIFNTFTPKIRLLNGSDAFERSRFKKSLMGKKDGNTCQRVKSSEQKN